MDIIFRRSNCVRIYPNGCQRTIRKKSCGELTTKNSLSTSVVCSVTRICACIRVPRCPWFGEKQHTSKAVFYLCSDMSKLLDDDTPSVFHVLSVHCQALPCCVHWTDIAKTTLLIIRMCFVVIYVNKTQTSFCI